MYKYNIGIVILFLFAACSKSANSDDVNNVFHIRGRVFIKDSITGIGEEAAVPNAMIMLSKQADTLAPLYDTVTDNDGYFQFENLSNNVTYYIYARKRVSADAIFYYKIDSLSPLDKHSIDNYSITLDLDRAQNLIQYVVEDIIGNGIISGCSVCFFKTSVLGYKDTSCNGSIDTVQSNEQGNAVKTNFAKNDTVYVVFNKRYDSTTLKAVDKFYYSGTYTKREVRIK